MLFKSSVLPVLLTFTQQKIWFQADHSLKYHSNNLASTFQETLSIDRFCNAKNVGIYGYSFVNSDRSWSQTLIYIFSFVPGLPTQSQLDIYSSALIHADFLDLLEDSEGIKKTKALKSSIKKALLWFAK